MSKKTLIYLSKIPKPLSGRHLRSLTGLHRRPKRRLSESKRLAKNLLGSSASFFRVTSQRPRGWTLAPAFRVERRSFFEEERLESGWNAAS